MTDLTTFDKLKGAALVCTFLGFLATCAALESATYRDAIDRRFIELRCSRVAVSVGGWSRSVVGLKFRRHEPI